MGTQDFQNLEITSKKNIKPKKTFCEIIDVTFEKIHLLN